MNDGLRMVFVAGDVGIACLISVCIAIYFELRASRVAEAQRHALFVERLAPKSAPVDLAWALVNFVEELRKHQKPLVELTGTVNAHAAEVRALREVLAQAFGWVETTWGVNHESSVRARPAAPPAAEPSSSSSSPPDPDNDNSGSDPMLQ
jgi:hypothetical protein